MPLPELSADKKFQARDIQLRIMQIQEGIRSLQQKAQNETTRLRALIEGWTAEAGLGFDKVTFDLDALKWADLPPAPAPPAPPGTVGTDDVIPPLLNS